MISAIVHELEPVLLVGGGKYRKSGLKAAEGRFRRIVVADGGADWLLSRGYEPDMVIGDLDSISDSALTRLGPERVHRVDEQDSTDFEKCLVRIDAPLVLGAGFLGGRVDHELAALHVLAALPAQRCVLIGRDDIVFLAPPEMRLDLARGTRVSLFPLGQVRAKSQGLRWEVNEVRFDTSSKIGTSNEALGPVELSVEAANMLVILPRSALGLALEALSTSGGGWPPRKAS
ncbi:thiamine diphosphokinase [Lentibacter sp. XHP0401]|jgi:thiamine pyrophosphokinase|uniref:thiamine diphosphokinase n=1 Tax=Lentibacter sp. XHP0401 TaxID=2984334 RepID=UPI0021E7FBB4|nr:thiamine diphosphokinase [Lentibacter sp. XHP0401]MCV2891488.1 thiamine diphosphokinase [Lentibacter sp. XHP0401]